MTFDERVQAVAKKGFTERQARFLTTVMLHSGVCVPRQYARFCGIVHGAKTRKFFAKLVRLGIASMHDCRHNRARIYHVNQRALYTAIGEPYSTFRRRMSINRAIQRLMVLDAIVEDPELVWLATAEDKAANLTALTSIAPADLRTPPLARAMLARSVTSRNACRIVAPPQFPGIGERARKAVEDQRMRPMRALTIDEMRWYFEQLRASSPSDVERFKRCRRAFSTPKSQVIYGLWKHDGEAALVNAGSDALRNAIEAASGSVEVLELGHRYGHLSPLAAVS